MLNCANMISSIFGYMTNPKLCIFVKPPKNLNNYLLTDLNCPFGFQVMKKTKGGCP